mmetsp:Transcript_2142/g.5354  ORF Transcript_2142/g.5354 Transcript_2142/m.5354 type:complete len:150 (-) Transcript_2142:472-921(-)
MDVTIDNTEGSVYPATATDAGSIAMRAQHGKHCIGRFFLNPSQNSPLHNSDTVLRNDHDSRRRTSKMLRMEGIINSCSQLTIIVGGGVHSMHDNMPSATPQLSSVGSKRSRTAGRRSFSSWIPGDDGSINAAAIRSPPPRSSSSSPSRR